MPIKYILIFVLTLIGCYSPVPEGMTMNDSAPELIITPEQSRILGDYHHARISTSSTRFTLNDDFTYCMTTTGCFSRSAKRGNWEFETEDELVLYFEPYIYPFTNITEYPQPAIHLEIRSDSLITIRHRFLCRASYYSYSSEPIVYFK